jgi:hypothetical protein
MRDTHTRSWKFAGFVAVALAIAALLLAATGEAQRPDRVLYPVKGGGQEAGGGQPGRAGLPPDWRVAEGVTYENLTVFPVLARTDASTGGYITLDEGLASGQVVVAESGSQMIRRSRDGRPIPAQSYGAQVNQLVLVNRSARPLILLAGELVSGGKQDRIIGKDRIVAPNSEPLPLDVFCVEHGRWTGASSNFNEAKIIVHPSVRENAAVEKDQGKVWASVREGSNVKASRDAAPAAAPAVSGEMVAGVINREARSEAYEKVYRQGRIGQSVESFTAEIERRFAKATAGLKGERVVGVVIAYGAEVAWSDSFASGDLFAKYWSKLLRSYVVEALARSRTSERATLEDAREFLAPLTGREQVESEPGVYRWRQITHGRLAEIELESLPKPITLHRVKIQRTS